MATDHVPSDHPRITVDLQLDSSLARQLDLDALQGEMSRDLGEMLQVLGTPGEPLVQITAIEDAVTDAERFIAVSVNGQPCSSPSELLHLVYHYVADEDSHGSTTSARVLALLRELAPEQIGAFVRLTCGEMIKRSPAVLLTAESVTAYRAALMNGSDETFLPDAHWLQTPLAAVLNLRISIADRATVAQVLQQGIVQERSPAAITEDLIAALRPQSIEIQLPLAYLRQITLDTPESDRSKFALMRDGLFYELGLRFPAAHFVPTEDLKPDSLRFKINHLTTLPIRGLHPDECLVNDETDRLGLLRIQGRAAINPANLSACSVIRVKDANLAEEAGLTTWNQIDYLVLAMSAELRAHAVCFLDRKEVDAYLDNLEWAFPQLVEAARTRISPELMTQTLRLLLAEETSIRNLRQILQTMIEYGFDDSKYVLIDPQMAARGLPGDEWLNNPTNLASFVRVRLKKPIGHKYTRGGNTLVVYLLDLEIEALLANHQMMATDAYLARLEPGDRDRIVAAVRAELGSLPAMAQVPVVLTTSSVRPIFRELIARVFPRVAVMCYQELSPDLNIQPIARIGLS